MTKKVSVLIVDDQADMLETLIDILEARGFEVASASDGFKALNMAEKEDFDVVLMDVKMPGINGVETFKRIKRIRPEAKVIMMSAYAVEDLVREALREGAIAMLGKPLDVDALIRIIEKAEAGQGASDVAAGNVLKRKGIHADNAKVRKTLSRVKELVFIVKVSGLNGLSSLGW